MVYTTSDYVINCEQISWTVGPDNDRTAYLKDADGCCRRIDNFDSSNPNYFEHDISPVSNCTTLQSTERVSKKLITNVLRGANNCLFIYICHPSRNGILVACRQKPDVTLLTWIVMNLVNLLKGILQTPTIKLVNQTSCIFTNNCFF